MRPMVEAAQNVEKESHRQLADQKAAGWLIKMANSTGLEMDDDLKYEISQKL